MPTAARGSGPGGATQANDSWVPGRGHVQLGGQAVGQSHTGHLHPKFCDKYSNPSLRQAYKRLQHSHYEEQQSALILKKKLTHVKWLLCSRRGCSFFPPFYVCTITDAMIITLLCMVPGLRACGHSACVGLSVTSLQAHPQP